ncbi:hypothetical protein BG006_008747 [Podila minutissima]|uniref:Methyltransferase domain-containing protein n=1 Tax=Podila minutissima TaxID=64525 RepID=A0A9P5SG23_9FUNG|nr:hypothetical protein BG006_008747 [Podila minutissima]
MANEFPDAIVTGIDMSSVFPTTIIPGNCRFIQHNIIQGLPFPDNHFDLVYQRLLIAGLTPANWIAVVAELERVTKPGGWIELVEVDGFGGNNGPSTAKIWGWVQTAFAARGMDTLVGRQPGLANLLKQANVANVRHDILKLPTGEHGGKIGTLLMENEHSFWNAMTPVLLHAGGADKYELERAMDESRAELEKYKSYHIFYNAYGQKRERSQGMEKEEEEAGKGSWSRPSRPVAL